MKIMGHEARGSSLNVGFVRGRGADGFGVGSFAGGAQAPLR